MENKGNISLPIKYDQLTIGHEFPPVSYDLNPSVVSKYVEAVGEHDPLARKFVSPLAIAAYAITAMSGFFVLPPGVIHASQELEAFKLVPIGTRIECHSRVSQIMARGNMHLLAIEFDAFDQEREKVLSGKATLVLSG